MTATELTTRKKLENYPPSTFNSQITHFGKNSNLKLGDGEKASGLRPDAGLLYAEVSCVGFLPQPPEQSL